jgi:hypothetical protein
MAGDYIVKCVLTVDGVDESDFESVEEKEVDYAKRVELQNKTGFAELTPRYEIDVSYVVPAVNPRDWTKVKDATLIITDDGGNKTTYTGVCRLKVGTAKRDGKEELKQLITLGATKKI